MFMISGMEVVSLEVDGDTALKYNGLVDIHREIASNRRQHLVGVHPQIEGGRTCF